MNRSASRTEAPVMEDELELLSPDDVARLFKTTRQTVLRYARGPRKTQGAVFLRNTPPPLPSIKIGRGVKFQERAVTEWLEGLKRNYPNHYPSAAKRH